MIWCVDDDKTILDIEVYTLESMGFKAKGFADGLSMLEALKQQMPELIVLDIMLPGVDGVEILRRLRANAATKKLPVIMATAKGTEIDKIQGLDAGADDYLVKPFGMMEMVSRIKAVLRRCDASAAEETHRAGDICLSCREHLVTVGGQEVTLTPKEFALLKLLLENPGMAFSRDRLLSEIWGVDYLGESRTVDMHVKTLRHKLGESGKRIQTVIGVGYRLEGQK